MHFEILVEDSSGKKALDILIPKIIDMNAGHTFRVHSYKGSGHIPRDLQSVSDPSGSSRLCVIIFAYRTQNAYQTRLLRLFCGRNY